MDFPLQSSFSPPHVEYLPMLSQTECDYQQFAQRQLHPLPLPFQYSQANVGFGSGYLVSTNPDSNLMTGPKEEPKRRNVNLKERRRNEALNQGFLRLQRLIPYVPGQQRLPKIKTLRLAVSYIRHLSKQLQHDTSVGCPHDASSTPACCSAASLDRNSHFAQVVASEIQTRNSYKHRADQLLNPNVPHFTF